MARTRLVAIVNVTPDSFSDGGVHFDAADALGAIAQYIKDGADVIDIGAESTRPGATPVEPDEEWARLAPVLEARPRGGACFSVDTRHDIVAKKALDAGVQWINDVSGFTDPEMVAAVQPSPCILVVMHSLSVPADKSVVLPEDADAVHEVLTFAQIRISALEAAGVEKERIIFDPGIGFGKTARQSQDMLRRIGEFSALGVPLMVGHSRKSFLGEGDRDAATLEWSEFLIKQGVDYLRVHDVAAHKRLLERLHG